MSNYIVSHFMPGFLPDDTSHTTIFDEADEAIVHWRSEVRHALDDLASPEQDEPFLQADTALHVTSDDNIREALESGSYSVDIDGYRYTIEVQE